ncbi:MAG: cyclic nucleotide-binding domain-containing protein [Deltaproteobacteria bacterium]|nr:cyclic nucleotide-binding domain-containing protein [Deltaproteobacteria bacterium]
MAALDAATVSAAKNSAEDFFSKGKFQEAFSAYEKIKPYGEKDPRIFMRLGDIARKTGDDAAAIGYYKDTVRAYIKQGFAIKAIAVCKMIIGIDPSQKEIEKKIADMCARGPGGGTGGAPTAAPAPAPAQPGAHKAQPPPAAQGAQQQKESPRKLPRTPLFSDLTEPEFIEVLKKVKSRSVPAGEFLFKEGDRGDSIFILVEGSIEVIGHAKDGTLVTLATLQEGALFGEFGFFSGAKRTSGVKAAEPATILELTKADMNDIITRHKRVEAVLFDFYKSRVVDRLMGLSAIFKPINKTDRKEILSRLSLVKFQRGDDIVKEGDKGETMYLIKNGRVEAWVKGKGAERILLAELGEGDFFGEIALATSKPRVATVSAVEDVELVAFSRSMIKDILAKYPEVKQTLERVIKERVGDTAKAREQRAAVLV